jgi:hypothetical protein
MRAFFAHAFVLTASCVVAGCVGWSGLQVETTVPGEVVKHGHVTCVGYKNMESRMAVTASSLFSGNVTNFLLSMQDKEKNWHVNLEDPAVRSVLVSYKGEKLPPYVAPAAPAAAASTKATKQAEALPEDPQKLYLRSALQTTLVTSGALYTASLVHGRHPPLQEPHC